MSVSIDYLKVCRICLGDDNVYDIRELKSRFKWISDIKVYYRVNIIIGDNKSKSLCSKCIGKIESWRRDVQNAKDCQRVIDFIDEHDFIFHAFCRQFRVWAPANI